VAVKTYYLGSGQDGNFGALFDGVAQTAASRADGWTVAKIATVNASDFDAATKQASGTFAAASGKPAALITSALANALKTPAALNGSFANTSWAFTFAVRAGTLSAQAGRIRMRVYRSVNADGSGATEITGATQVGTTSTVLSTTADVTTVVTWSPGATINLANEYLFFVLAWEITTQAGSNSADVLLRTGSTGPAGSRLVTPDFVPAQTLSIGRVAPATTVRGATLSGSGTANLAIGKVGAGVVSIGPAYDSAPTQTVTAAADWTNLGNASAADGIYATAVYAGSGFEQLTFDNFGLTLPVGATVTDVTVEVLIGGGGGSLVVTPNVSPNVPYSPGTVSAMTLYTGSGLWNHPTWTKAEIDGLSFALVVNGIGTQNLDYFRVTVSYTAPVGAVVRGITVSGSGSAALAVGRVAGGVSYAAKVLADSPTGYWRMDDAGNPTDSSPSANHMTGFGGTAPTQVAGLLATDPASTAKGFVNAFYNRGGLLYPLNTFSIEAWVKRNSLGSAVTLLSQYNGGLRLDIDAAGTLSLIKSFAGYCATSSALKILDTNKHHIVVTRNGIGGAVVFYLDGASETPTPGNPNFDFSGGANNGFFIGSEWGTNPLDGTLDEVAVYPSVLSAAQVAAHYSAGTVSSGTSVVYGVTPGYIGLFPSVGKVASATAVRGVTLAPGDVSVAVGRRAAATTVRGVTLAPGPVAFAIGKRAAATTVYGATLTPTGAAPIILGKKVAATTVRGVTLVRSGEVTLPIGRVAPATVVRGLQLLPPLQFIPLGWVPPFASYGANGYGEEVYGGQTVYGVTLVNSGLSIVVGKKVAATTVRGVTPAATGTVQLVIGKKVSSTAVRGITLAPGVVGLPIGRRASATTVRGITLVATGTAPIPIGSRATATTVRGVTLSAAGAVPLPIGKVAAVTTVRGVTLVVTGAAPITVGRRAAATTVRGIVVTGTGTIGLTIGRRTAATIVAGVTVTATGAATVVVGTRIAATTVRGVTVVSLTIPVPTGRVASTTVVRGATLVTSGSAPIVVGKRAAATTVRGATLSAAGVAPLAVGKRVAATTVRGITLAGSGAVPITIGRRAAATIVYGATLVATGAAPLTLGRVASVTVVKGVTLVPGPVTVTIGRRAPATTVRGIVLSPGVATIPVGIRPAGTAVRGITLIPSAITIGRVPSSTIVRGLQLTTITPQTIPIGRRAAATTVRGVTLAVAGPAPITVGKRAAATTVRGLTLVATGAVPVPVGRAASVTAVRGVTLAAVGAATVPIGKRASTTQVRGAVLSGSGTVTLLVGRRTAATTVRGLSVAPGVVQVPVGRRVSASIVRGVTPVATGTAGLQVGRRVSTTVVFGVTLVPGAIVITIGHRIAITTVRGVTLATFGAAYGMRTLVDVYQEAAILVSVSPSSGQIAVTSTATDAPRITTVSPSNGDSPVPDFAPDQPHLTGVS
jgi:Concanavalin A-like lectin/glucanases superfamily